MVLSIEKKQVEPDVVVLVMNGKISMGRESLQIEWQVEELIQQKTTKVVFDMSEVQYMDSTGLGIIAFCCGKLKESGGGLRVAGAKGAVESIFRITKLDKVVGLYPTAEAAAESFTPTGASGQSA